MALLIRKADNFILNARAIAWPHSLNFAAVKWGAVQVIQNDLLGIRVGIGNVAKRAVLNRLRCSKGEGHRMLIARLRLQFCKIDAPPVYPGGRAGFKAPGRNA